MPTNFQTIASQVVQALRTEIKNGTWGKGLPGERQLAENFHVSRKTVRKALAALRREGMLSTQSSRGSVIVTRKVPRKTNPRVALLLPQPLEASRPFTALWVNRLMGMLHQNGQSLQIFHGSKYFSLNPARSLDRLTSTHSALCWIVGGSNQPVQEWFGASGVPTLIAGSAYPGVPLPSVDVDHRALCRHGASLLLRQGHRQLTLFLEHVGHGGDSESEQGFREGVAATGAPEPFVCRPERSAASIIREVKRLLARRDRPTGFFLSNAHSYLTVLSYLGSVGRHVPEDISVISRDEETFLRFMYPTPTYYSTRPLKFAQALNQVLKRTLGGDRTPFKIRIMPDLVPGNSVAPMKGAG